ncbi:golgin-45 isoform X2 [Thrips palmi]|nr:golgin-45 isoform X2 [Thrips palmi]
MENDVESLTKSETQPGTSSKPSKKSLVDDFLYRPADVSQRSLPPPVLPGRMVSLTSNNIIHLKKDKHNTIGFKSKEPKFVPYEPYKAAVNPIVPIPRHKGSMRALMTSTAACHKSSIKEDKIRKESIKSSVSTEPEQSKEGGECKPASQSRDEAVSSDSSNEWKQEKKLMEAEIQQLKDDNCQLEIQLKFQTQVNGELKKLLVAAVGEDIETRVNHLTEDKVHLARALLTSAQSQSTHQEQTEWLAGQCEVWRSKFLASSLMVEELARWKAALSQKAIDLQEVVQRMLEERCKIRSSLLDCHRKLSVLRDNFDLVSAVSGGHSTSRRHLSSSSIVDLTNANQKLCDAVTVQLLGSAINKIAKFSLDYQNLDQYTPTEKVALQLLQQPVTALLAGGPDAACNAVMGAAMALGGSQLFPQAPRFACCAHCSGEIKQM